MKEAWVAGTVIISPLGKTTSENYRKIARGISGLKELYEPELSKTPIIAGRIQGGASLTELTPFESICCEAIDRLLEECDVPVTNSLLILSSTKGNISTLENGNAKHPRLSLHATAQFFKELYGFHHHLVVSNACISGVLGIIVGKRFLESGKYNHVVVLGADTLSRFIISGFQSLQALSNAPCRPFDIERNGINLGEAAGAILLCSERDKITGTPRIQITGTGVTNDANHISGPSRTGEELSAAIFQATREASLTSQDIDFISAHGTATVYNDEMEGKAFALSGMLDTPVNSLKGYFGHTLGAAGVIETIISAQSLMNDQLIPTKGFITKGVSENISVIRELTSSPVFTCLKTASGFGGCNAALVLQKENN